jgi:DNA-binding response OmpR family regulator
MTVVSDQIIDLGEIKMDKRSRKLVIDDSTIPLRNMEFSLLEYFMENVGRVLSRTELLEEVWDRNICCATNTVDVHVSSLRKKMEKYFSRNVIRTVHCIGYIFDY